PSLSPVSPEATRWLLPMPTRVGLGRGYVAGGIDVDDLDAFAALLNDWSAPSVGLVQRLRLLAAAVIGGAVGAEDASGSTEDGCGNAGHRASDPARRALPSEFFA